MSRSKKFNGRTHSTETVRMAADIISAIGAVPAMNCVVYCCFYCSSVL